MPKSMREAIIKLLYKKMITKISKIGDQYFY